MVEKCNLMLFFRKRVNFLFTNLKGRSNEYKADLIKTFREDCLKDFVEGRLKAIVDREFDMSDAAKAHEVISGNQTIGKLLLKYNL